MRPVMMFKLGGLVSELMDRFGIETHAFVVMDNPDHLLMRRSWRKFGVTCT